MKKTVLMILTSCLLIGLFTWPCQAASQLEANALNSPAAVLMDAASGRVLFSKNGDEKRYPASLTKVMTMLLGVENLDLKQEVTVSSEASLSIEFGSSHISLMPGEIIQLEDVMKACSIVSANDAANVIAEAVSGDITSFTELMNERASAIGCQQTHFTNPHGLHDEDHYSTAIDLAKIMSEAVRNPAYLALTAQQSAIIEPTNLTAEKRYLYGQNRCMDESDSDYIPEVLSAKAGYTIASKNSYLAYAKKGQCQFVVCLLGASSASEYDQDLKIILQYAFANYTADEEIAAKITLPRVPHSWLEIGGKTRLKEEFAYPVYQADEKDYFHFVSTFDANAHDAKEGEIVGELTLYYQDEKLSSQALILDSPVRSIFAVLASWLFTLLKIVVLLCVLALIGLVTAKKIYTYYRRQKRRRRRNRR